VRDARVRNTLSHHWIIGPRLDVQPRPRLPSSRRRRKEECVMTVITALLGVA
jgi:hypothetical protein